MSPLVTHSGMISGQGFLDLLSQLVCLVHGGVVTYINAAGVRLLGLPSKSSAEGLSFETWVGIDYRFLMEAGWELLAAETFVPMKLLRADGTSFEAELRVRSVDEGDTFMVEARDISEFMRSAEALREREERLQGILAAAAEGIVTINAEGVIESANLAAEQMFGYTPGQLLGLIAATLAPPLARVCAINTPSSSEMGVPSKRVVEGIGRRKDKTTFPIELSISELWRKRQRSFITILRDISERKENEERIQHLAHHDNLTNLPNRNLLRDRLTHAIARAKRRNEQIAILYLDLDHFKPINDTLGHEAGDAVLCEVALRLTAALRSNDTVSRIGGDEFVVLIEDVLMAGEVALIAQKLINALLEPIVYNEHSCQIGASVGIALFPGDAHSTDDLLKAADVAMYRVKHTGRNNYAFFSQHPIVSPDCILP